MRYDFDPFFKKDALGNTLFYPWGTLGSGFIIDSEDKKKQIRKFYKKTCIILAVLGVISKKNTIFLLIFALYSVWSYYALKKITQDLQKTEIKLKISEITPPLPILIFCELASLGLVTMGIRTLLMGQESFKVYTAIGFFCLIAVFIGYLIVEKIRNK